MTDEENERIWRGVHPLRAWMLRMARRLPPWHRHDRARAVHGRHDRSAETMHDVKRPK